MSPVLRRGVRDLAFVLIALVIVGAVFLFLDVKLSSLWLIGGALLLGMALRTGWREYRYRRDIPRYEPAPGGQVEQ